MLSPFEGVGGGGVGVSSEEVVALKKSVLEEVEATLALVPRDSVMLSVLRATLCLTPSIPPATILLLSRDWDSPCIRCVL